MKEKKNKLQDWKIKLRDLFLELLINENKSTLLDIGAGAGTDSKFFMNNNIDVMAVDLSDEMISLCQEKGINHGN